MPRAGAFTAYIQSPNTERGAFPEGMSHEEDEKGRRPGCVSASPQKGTIRTIAHNPTLIRSSCHTSSEN
jgi:hypothetical protein